MTEEEIKNWQKIITESGAFRSNGNLSLYWISTLSKNIDLSSIPGDSVQEKVYVIFKNNGEIGKCKICGKPTKFRNFYKGYSKTCSDECKKKVDINNLNKIPRIKKVEKKPTPLLRKIKKAEIENPVKNSLIETSIRKNTWFKDDIDSLSKKTFEFLKNRGFNWGWCSLPDIDYKVYCEDKIVFMNINTKDKIIPPNVVNIRPNHFEEDIKLLLNKFGIDYEKEIQRIKDNLPKEFPFYNYNEEKLRGDYKKLCNYRDYKTRSRIADSIISQFHKSIYSARVGNKVSPYEAWNNEILLDKCIRNRFIYGRNFKPHSILNGFNVCKIATKVSVFSSSLAKGLIDNYLKDFDTIFDPFSGFSGRMLGACSLGKKYIGQDINIDHVTESNEIIRFYNLNAEVKCKDIFESEGEYECLFTCPPYGNKEDWGNENQKVLSCDEWIDECLKRFKCKKYMFVIDNTEKYKDNIVETLGNKSHFSEAKEYVILI